MSSPPSDLSLPACLDRYRGVRAAVSLAVAASVDSTNRLARRIADPYLATARRVPRLAILARTQTAGRGRRERSWSSPAGEGVYASLLLPVASAEALAALPLRVPLALCELLDAHGADCAIKWPNDLVVGGRKLGGVLIEGLAGGRVAIVGYGINGNQEKPDRPVPGAISLRLATGAAVDLSALAVELTVGLDERLRRERSGARLVEAYAARSAHRRGEPLVVRLGPERVAGRFAGFDPRGRLRLETAGGPRVFGSADMLDPEAAPDGPPASP